MSFSTKPLSYCTNVHPGKSVCEIEQGLDEYTVPVSKNYAGSLAAGLWLANSVVGELLRSTDQIHRFTDGLALRGLTCHTLNAFPYGDFHSPRVKEQVYLPDWANPKRLQYTHECARVLVSLLGGELEGSVSTLPLGFKQFDHPADFVDRCIENLIELACGLDRIYSEEGKLIRLAIEPEPYCLLETTAETLQFFDRLRQRAADDKKLELVQRYLGVCFDICHQAVEFEDVAESIRALSRANVRINKVHITCAIQISRPAEDGEARQALSRYVEPKYLHQTLARSSSGKILRVVDLTEELVLDPDDAFLDAEQWRVHFHVPVDAETLGPLQTTRTDLKQALAAVSRLDYAPHLEVETYTWEVLPTGRSSDLVDGLTGELVATRDLLAELGSDSDESSGA